jgi:hypothetical protein
MSGLSLQLLPMTRTAREPRPPARWLVLAYLAGDNDLEKALLDDLGEMERVGSRPGAVEILAQVDRGPTKDAAHGKWKNTRRYYVTKAPVRSRVLADLGPTNTGDPAVIEGFIRFGAQRYPAEATALILSNHGSGLYVPPEMNTHGRAPGRGRRHRRPLFHTTREHLTAPAGESRGIAYDESAGDCLDNMELKRVLAGAQAELGRPVDVVGMDACLMTMLEVAYQLKDHARILVGSEALEPGPGWPHDAIWGELTARPEMTAATLANTIVTHYADSYEGSAEDATQSAIDLTQLEDLVEAVDQLAGALLKALPNARLSAAITTAWRWSLRFFDSSYVDLHDLVAHLARVGNIRSVRQACRAVQEVVGRRGPGHPVLAEAHVGTGVGHARGLSVYFPPFRDPSVYYRELDFARRTRWADFLEAYLGEDRA